jgi:hypothetical protein
MPTSLTQQNQSQEMSFYVLVFLSLVTTIPTIDLLTVLAANVAGGQYGVLKQIPICFSSLPASSEPLVPLNAPHAVRAMAEIGRPGSAGEFDDR